MAFMISKETENVHSSEEIENAFRAIAAGDRPYVTKDELYQVSVECPTAQNKAIACVSYSSGYKSLTYSLHLQNLTKEMADYCAGRMKAFVDPKTGQPVAGALDYIDFTQTLFSN